MKKLLIILIVCCSFNGFAQEKCDSVYLEIGSLKIDLKTEDFIQTEDEYGDPIESITKKELRYTLGDSIIKIKVHPYEDYGIIFYESEYGDPTKIDVYNHTKDTMEVTKYLGVVDKDTLLEYLLSDISISGCKKKIPVNNNCYIYLSKKDDFIKISRAEIDYYPMMVTEFKSLKKGDLIITGNLYHKSEMFDYSEYPFSIGAIYWKIK